MKLKNKKTGEIITKIDVSQDNEGIWILGNKMCFYSTLADLNADWEDYEPIQITFDEKIRRGIRAWWDMQDNPFKSASVMCYEKKDQDGFYHWKIFGYIRDGEEKVSTDLCFRTKKLYAYEKFHDYTKEELCGEDEEC